MGMHHVIILLCFTLLTDFSITLAMLNVGVVPSGITLAVPTLLYTLIQLKLICQIKWKLPAFADQLLFQIPLSLRIVNRIKRNKKLLNAKVQNLKLSLQFHPLQKIHCKNQSHWCRTQGISEWKTRSVKLISPEMWTPFQLKSDRCYSTSFHQEKEICIIQMVHT